MPAEGAVEQVGVHSGRYEEAEAAVVGFVGGEAGDLPLMLHIEDGGAVRGLESPDGSECAFDEIQNREAVVALCVADNLVCGLVCGRRQDCLRHTEPYFQVLCPRGLSIS